MVAPVRTAFGPKLVSDLVKSEDDDGMSRDAGVVAASQTFKIGTPIMFDVDGNLAALDPAHPEKFEGFSLGVATTGVDETRAGFVYLARHAQIADSGVDWTAADYSGAGAQAAVLKQARVANMIVARKGL